MYNSTFTLQVENNELTSDPYKMAQAFNLAFFSIAQRCIDVSLQGTLDLRKLRSFVGKMKPSGERFNISLITSCLVKEQINSISTTNATGSIKFRSGSKNFVPMKSPIL